jgi:hypothetical protein
MLFGIYFFSLGGNGASALALYLFGALGPRGAGDPDHHASRCPSSRWSTTLEIPLREQIISAAHDPAPVRVRVLLRAAQPAGHRRGGRALDRAVRAVSMREALLAEVRQELDRALKVGGPGATASRTWARTAWAC